jgi:hypothetical protein
MCPGQEALQVDARFKIECSGLSEAMMPDELHAPTEDSFRSAPKTPRHELCFIFHLDGPTS